MRTLQIQISDDEFSRLGLQKNDMSFDELKRRILIQSLQITLKQAQIEAIKTGLENLTSDEINAEIQAVRKHD